MLADEIADEPAGRLRPTLHKPAAWLETLVDFIYSQLAPWRDDTRRTLMTAETRLTAQLCQFLNNATRSAGLDSIVFQTEVPDASVSGRTLDLAPGPRGYVIWIEGRRHSLYDPILPIECKRLPTPVGRKRERREYLHTQKRTTGAIQRFKMGFHGSCHSMGVIIGYVQEPSLSGWLVRINHWVRVLSRARILGWSQSDALGGGSQDVGRGIARHRSINARAGTPPITLHHLWVDMSRGPGTN